MGNQTLVTNTSLETNTSVGIDEARYRLPGRISRYDHGGYVVVDLTVDGHMSGFGCNLLAGSRPVVSNIVAALPFADTAISRGGCSSVGRYRGYVPVVRRTGAGRGRCGLRLLSLSCGGQPLQRLLFLSVLRRHRDRPAVRQWLS